MLIRKSNCAYLSVYQSAVLGLLDVFLVRFLQMLRESKKQNKIPIVKRGLELRDEIHFSGLKRQKRLDLTSIGLC